MVTLKLFEAARAIGGFDPANGWPETFTSQQLAYLQTHQPHIDRTEWSRVAGPWLDAISQAVKSGRLPHTETTHPVMVRRPTRDLSKDSLFGAHYYEVRPAQYKTVVHHHITAPDFAAFLAHIGEKPGRLMAAWLEAAGVKLDAPEREQPRQLRKRRFLVKELEPEWPTIEGDLREASRNGLKDAAHVGGASPWDLEKAREWAKTNGKLDHSPPPAPAPAPASPWDVLGTR